MPKVAGARTIVISRAAKQAAVAAGKKWSDISPEDRKMYRREARVALGQGKGHSNAAREKAMKAVEASGRKWRDLSLDERKAYIKEARA